LEHNIIWGGTKIFWGWHWPWIFPHGCRPGAMYGQLRVDFWFFRGRCECDDLNKHQ